MPNGFRKKDSARLVWDTKPRRAPNPKDIEFQTAEVRAKMFNAELLLVGMAQVMTVPPNVKYADMFVKFQQEAREAGKGLWGLPKEGLSRGQESAQAGGGPKPAYSYREYRG